MVLVNALQAIPNSIATGNLANGQIALIHAANQLEQICLAMEVLKKDDLEYVNSLKVEKDRLFKDFQDSEGDDGRRLSKLADLAEFKVGLLEFHIMANKTLFFNGRV